MDLFASRLTYQVTGYMALQPDPASKAAGAFKQKMGKPLPLRISTDSLIGRRTFTKINKDQTRIIRVTPTWHTKLRYANVLHMSVRNPMLLSCSRICIAASSGMPSFAMICKKSSTPPDVRIRLLLVDVNAQRNPVLENPSFKILTILKIRKALILP